MSNFFGNLPTDLTQEVFEVLAGSEAVKIERIISAGHRSPESGWYDQAQNEWVIVLQGAAVLAFENGASIQMQPGDYVNIAAHQKHRVAWTDPHQPTLWLAVHYH